MVEIGPIKYNEYKYNEKKKKEKIPPEDSLTLIFFGGTVLYKRYIEYKRTPKYRYRILFGST